MDISTQSNKTEKSRVSVGKPKYKRIIEKSNLLDYINEVYLDLETGLEVFKRSGVKSGSDQFRDFELRFNQPQDGGYIIFERLNSTNDEYFRKYDNNDILRHYMNSNENQGFFNEKGHQTSGMVDGKLKPSELVYDDNGNLIYEKDPDGYFFERKYDEKGHLVYQKQTYTYLNLDNQENYRQTEKWWEYNKEGKLIHHESSTGQNEWFDYDKEGKLIHYESSSGEDEWFDYDEKGNLIHMGSYPDDDGKYEYEKWWEYDQDGICIHISDSKGYECISTVSEVTSLPLPPDIKRIENIINKYQKNEELGIEAWWNNPFNMGYEGGNFEKVEGIEGLKIVDSTGKNVYSQDENGNERWLLPKLNEYGGSTVYEKKSGGAEGWYEYDRQGTLRHYFEPDGYQEWMDTKGNLAAMTINGKVMPCSLKYDQQGKLFYQKNPTGYVCHNEYDGNGNLIYQRKENEKSQIAVESFYKYDDKGNLVYEKDQDGDEFWHDYDEKGNKIHSVDAKGNQQWWEYGQKGNVIHYKNSEGKDVREKITRTSVIPAPEDLKPIKATYDKFRYKDEHQIENPVTVDQQDVRIFKQILTKYPDNTIVLRIFDEDNRKLYFRGVDRSESWQEYDKNGRMIHGKSHGEEYWNTYDQNGKLIHYESTSGVQEWNVYNERGDKISTSDSYGNVEKYEYEYDDKGRQISYTVLDGNSNINSRIKTEYDANGNTTKVNLITATGYESEEIHLYDQKNNLIYEKTYDGIEKNYVYDQKGNLIHQKSQNHESWHTYDENGNETYRKEYVNYPYSKSETSFRYDENNNLIHKTFCGVDVENYEYDKNGNEVYYESETGLKKWRQFDDKGNEIYYKDSKGNEIQHEISYFACNDSTFQAIQQRLDWLKESGKIRYIKDLGEQERRDAIKMYWASENPDLIALATGDFPKREGETSNPGEQWIVKFLEEKNINFSQGEWKQDLMVDTRKNQAWKIACNQLGIDHNASHLKNTSQTVKIEKIKDAMKTIYSQADVDFEMLEILVKGLDAFEHGRNSLSFIRPSADQMKAGYNDGTVAAAWELEEITKGYYCNKGGWKEGIDTIEPINAMKVFATDTQAMEMAKKDGKRFLLVGRDLFPEEGQDIVSAIVDTPQSRSVLKKWLRNDLSPIMKAPSSQKYFDNLNEVEKRAAVQAYWEAEDPVMMEELGKLVSKGQLFSHPGNEWIGQYLSDNKVDFNTSYWKDIFAVENRIEDAFQAALNYMDLKDNGKYIGYEKEKLFENCLERMKTSYDEGKPLKSFETVAKIIRGLDAIKNDEESLSYIRPNGQQIKLALDNGWNFDEACNGYINVTSNFFENLDTIQRIDDAGVFPSDDQAWLQAKRDGVAVLEVGKDLFFPKESKFEGIEDEIFIDTPQSRLILKEYLRPDLRIQVDQKEISENPVNVFFAKVKDMIAETASAQQILYTAAKVLDEFSKEDKEKIGAYLSEKGADAKGNLEKVISKVLNPEKQQNTIQRKVKINDAERGR